MNVGFCDQIKTSFYSQSNRDYLVIFAFAIVALVLLIANPGYFNHDELQKLDHVKELGLKNYLETYVDLKQGSNFGVPVRPFSFLVQGGLAYFMEFYPVLVHLIAVLTHAAVGCLLYAVCKQLGAKRHLALVIALVFVANPLGMFATGWSAALMDRLYILFGVAAFICADKYIRVGANSRNLFWLFLWSGLSILSKETAVILPVLMCVIALLDIRTIKSNRFWQALLVWALPIFLFMLYRLPALIASFGSPDVGAYKASLNNIPEGIYVYLAYPFLVSTAEVGNWVFVTSANMFAAILLHAFVCIALGRVYGAKAIIIYLCGYFLFLAPVLLIPIRGAHYLYGSSIILSVGIGALILQNWRDFLVPKVIGFVALTMLLAHTINNQSFIYSLGRCMNVAQISTEATYISSNKFTKVDFQAEPGAPEHVLHRMVTGRNRIGETYPLELSVSEWGTILPDNTLALKMNSNCVVHLVKN